MFDFDDNRKLCILDGVCISMYMCVYKLCGGKLFYLGDRKMVRVECKVPIDFGKGYVGLRGVKY